MTARRTNNVQPLDFVFEISEEGFVFWDEQFEIPKAVVPNLSAYNEETEQWRLERINRAWGYADAIVSLFSRRYQSRWDGAIVALHDHKGMLRVIWRDEQSRVLFEGAIGGAWEQLGESWCSHGLSNN